MALNAIDGAKPERYWHLAIAAALLAVQVLINAGMNMSIMPITGIPLPFISYDNSFTMTTLAAIGLLESVALRRRRIVF